MVRRNDVVKYQSIRFEQVERLAGILPPSGNLAEPNSKLIVDEILMCI